MLLEADLPPADLASLDYVVSASGPLDAETRDVFESRYDVPLLLAYGATEFAGSVCTWTPELYREFGAVKRASSGRALPDTEVRIVDRDTGVRVAAGEQGLLEARIATVSADWIRTNESPRSMTTGSSPCTAVPTGRSTAAGSRCFRKPFGACWFRTRVSGTPPWWACLIRAWARCRSPRWNRSPATRHRRQGDRSHWSAISCPSTACRSTSSWSRNCRAPSHSR